MFEVRNETDLAHLRSVAAALTGEPPTAEAIADDWTERLRTRQSGAIIPVVSNAITALRHAPEWQGVLHFNESKLTIVARARPPFENVPSFPFDGTDEHDILAAAWLQGEGILVNREIAAQAVQAVAREHSFHPVRDYLDALQWDRTPRIDTWLTDYLRVNASEYASAVGAKWLISAVARVYQPGCKVDTCLILEGGQGSLKSTALRTLAGSEFFSDDIADLGSKDSVMQTRGVWVIEIAELDSMERREASAIKAFMSRQVDRIRPPYGRRVVSVPRECVFAGTTNKDVYLRDETGGRRFWPVKCGGSIQIDALRRDRDQLWAEARERFQAGATWWLDDPLLAKAASEEAHARYEGDPWEENIGEWIEGRESVSVAEILGRCLEKKSGAWSQSDKNRVARCLIAREWKRKQMGSGSKREWRYVSPVKNDDTSTDEQLVTE